MSEPVYDTDVSGVTVTLSGLPTISVTLASLPDLPTISDISGSTLTDLSGVTMADVSDTMLMRFMCACLRRFFLTRPLSSFPPVIRD
jgi:hypothetical protein